MLQMLTFLELESGTSGLQFGFILVGLNLLLFIAMIPYAGWVWKTSSYKKALMQLVKHELILLVLFVLVIFLVIIITSQSS